MDQEEFIIILNQKHYFYKKIGNTIVVDHPGHVDLDDLNTLPENIKFVNNGYVSLGGITVLPENIEFENNGEVYLNTGFYQQGQYKHPKSGGLRCRSNNHLKFISKADFCSQVSLNLSMKTVLYNVCVVGVLLLASFTPPLKARKITLPLENHLGHIQDIKVTTYQAINDSNGSMVKGGIVGIIELWNYDEYGDELEDNKYNAVGTLYRKIVHEYYPNGDIEVIRDSSEAVKVPIEQEHCVGCKGVISGYRMQQRIYNRKYTYLYDNSGNLLDSAEYASNNTPYCDRVKYSYSQDGRMLEKFIFRGNDIGNPNEVNLFRYNGMGQLIEKDEAHRNYAIYDQSPQPVQQTIYSHDAQGRVIDAATYRYPDGLIYDEVKTIYEGSEITTVKITYLRTNNTIISTDIKQFVKSNTIQEDTYDASGRLTGYTISHFDLEGHLLDKGEFQVSYPNTAKGDTVRINYTVTDKYYNVIEDDSYGGDGNLKNKNTYKYKYDSVGNWVEQLLVSNGKPVQITERGIHYFANSH